MKYALLVYADQSAWAGMTEEEALASREASLPKWLALFEELAKIDPGVEGTELDGAAGARTVRVRDGRRLVTDGPFAETKEPVVGTLGRASRLAQDQPILRIAAELCRHERPDTVDAGAAEPHAQAAVALLLDQLVGAAIQDLDRSRAVLAGRDLALEVRVVERVVLDVHC